MLRCQKNARIAGRVDAAMPPATGDTGSKQFLASPARRRHGPERRRWGALAVLLHAQSFFIFFFFFTLTSAPTGLGIWNAATEVDAVKATATAAPARRRAWRRGIFFQVRDERVLRGRRQDRAKEMRD